MSQVKTARVRSWVLAGIDSLKRDYWLRPEWTFWQRFIRMAGFAVAVDLILLGGWHGFGYQLLLDLPDDLAISAGIALTAHLWAKRQKN